jgi:hypothetical protein
MKDFDPNLLKVKCGELLSVDVPEYEVTMKFGLMSGQDFLDMTTVPREQRPLFSIHRMLVKAYPELSFEDFMVWNGNFQLAVLKAVGDFADFRVKV